jgi:SAM-dependent methyltransferase
MTSEADTPPGRLRALLGGYMVTQCLSIVARLGIADHLEAGPVAGPDLAKRTGADPDALARILRAAASVGVFEQTSDQRYAQTELSALLCENARPSLRHLAVLFGSDLYQAWGSAFDAVKTGKPIFEQVFGRPHFAYLAENAQSLETFTKAMAGTARGRVDALLQVDWSTRRRVVDVGGGDGTLLVELLGKNPSLEGVVFDLPEIEASARSKIAEAGVEKRCSFHAGSFLADDPPTADTYILARVLHNWGDDDAKGILSRIRGVAPAGARLVVIDDVLSAGSEFENGKFLDLQMLVILGGRERTADDWRTLLGSEGFEVTDVRRDPRFGLIEARAI